MNHVIRANHMISLITSSTTDPRCHSKVSSCYSSCHANHATNQV